VDERGESPQTGVLMTVQYVLSSIQVAPNVLGVTVPMMLEVIAPGGDRRCIYMTEYGHLNQAQFITNMLEASKWSAIQPSTEKTRWHVLILRIAPSTLSERDLELVTEPIKMTVFDYLTKTDGHLDWSVLQTDDGQKWGLRIVISRLSEE
jgi:hypothetical protein